MNKKLFTNLGIALITPFDKNGKIDKKSLSNLVEHCIKGGADFLTVLGTTAESATMSQVERDYIVKSISEQNNGRVKILVGIGGNNTTDVIESIKHSKWENYCDGILSVVPFYNKPSQDGMFKHFQNISSNSPLPIVLYNIPGRTGVNMIAETTIKLAESCPNIIGIKEATGNFDQATKLLKIHQMRPDFSILSGEDAIVVPLMSIGFDGVISVAANQEVAGFKSMCDAISKGNLNKAQQLHAKYADFCRAIFKEGNPSGIKASLKISSIITNDNVRLPLTSVSKQLYNELKLIKAAMN